MSSSFSTSNNDNFTFDKFHEINSEYSLFMTATQKDIIDRKKIFILCL